MENYIKLCFLYLIDNILVFFLLAPTVLAAPFDVAFLAFEEEAKKLSSSLQSVDALYVLLSFFFVFFLASSFFFFFFSRPRSVYLVDFSCFKPPESCRFPHSKFMEVMNYIDGFNSSSKRFQRTILERSGLSDDTCLPLVHHTSPYDPSMAASRAEAELVIFSVVDSLLRKTQIRPEDVDILIVNCSLFCSCPSLSSMIINRYKMRSDVRSFNLGGMGCSAGLISVCLARDELRAHLDSRVLVVTTEILSEHLYTGNEREMLVSNCLFRMGGAAILLSNRRADRRRANYELLHLVRTHRGADDQSYRCVFHEEDCEGKLGMSLSKDLMEIAGSALKVNITTLGPLVLPFSEQIFFFLSILGRKMINPRWKPYVPDFTKAFEHFCIHAGGRAVIEKLATSLRLTAEQVEASKMTLHRMGNTSSSSPWYELGYVEAKGRMKKGDRVWQIGLGSGFKCNSAVWRCRRTVGREEDGAWSGCIDEYPAVLPELMQ